MLGLNLNRPKKSAVERVPKTVLIPVNASVWKEFRSLVPGNCGNELNEIVPEAINLVHHDFGTDKKLAEQLVAFYKSRDTIRVDLDVGGGCLSAFFRSNVERKVRKAVLSLAISIWLEKRRRKGKVRRKPKNSPDI